MAAPTKYKPEYCEQIIKFFSIAPTETVKKITTANPFPTIERFCANLKISITTLHEWTKQHDAFMDAYSVAKIMQKDILIQNSLTGRFQSNFAKFVAINCTDMSEKSEVHHTGNLTQGEIVDKIAAHKNEGH